MDEGIFVRKAQFEQPLSPSIRNSIIRKSQEKGKKAQPKKVRFNPETPEIGNNPLWEDKLEEKWADLYWQFQNIINSSYTFLPQLDPEPIPNPPLSNENLAELRQFSEELIGTGNRIREIGEQISWKYDEREYRY